MPVGLPPYRWRAAHLAALWGYGIAQPVFSMLEGNPEFLVVRGSTRAEVLVFALVIAFLPPLMVLGVEFLIARLSVAASGVVHLLAVWLFGFTAALQLLGLLDPSKGLALLLPVAASYVFVLAYLRWNAVRSFLSLSVVLPLAALLLFVANVPLAIDDREGAHVAVDGRTPIVMVVLDEFSLSSLLRPDGSLDAVRYPGFARLARGGTWYPRATTVHEHTTQAVPAILTGQLPKPGELPTLADHPDNLFTLLGESYEFDAKEQVTRLCPVRYCPESRPETPLVDRFRGLFYDVGVGFLHGILPTSLRGELPPIGDRWGGFGDEAGADARERLLGARTRRDVDLAIERDHKRPRGEFETFLATLGTSKRARTLSFLHLLLPHSPWHLLPSGREYGNAGTIDGTRDGWNRWENIPWLVDQELQRYLLQVGYTDSLVGRLLDRLEESGMYDRSMIVVTADHGVNFEPGGWRRLVESGNIPEIAPIPLFVKYPGQHAPRVDERAAQTIDIVPTIADVLGVELPWSVDGTSLRGAPVAREAAVERRSGRVVTAPLERIREGVLRAAKRNAALFGTGTTSLYRLGAHKELLGRSVADLPRSVGGASSVHLDGETLLSRVDLTSVFLPSRVVGEIEEPPAGSSRNLAIAVNGRIVALTRRYTLDGRERFAAMVPEGAFHNGANDVDVYAVDGKGKRVLLVRLGGTDRTPQYALAADGGSIARARGGRVRVEVGRIDGRVEAWDEDEGTVQIRGWAADLEDQVLPDQILLFEGGQLLYAGETTIVRWDVEQVSGKRRIERAGWVAELPAASLGGGSLRVFAVRGDVASELGWSASRARLPRTSALATD